MNTLPFLGDAFAPLRKPRGPNRRSSTLGRGRRKWAAVDEEGRLERLLRHLRPAVQLLHSQLEAPEVPRAAARPTYGAGGSERQVDTFV